MTNINLEYLINSVQEKFYDFESYQSKPKGYFGYGGKGEKEHRYYERAVHHGTNYIYDVCNILQIDVNRLYLITRAIRKWQESTNWQFCFDFKNNEEKIMKYLQK